MNANSVFKSVDGKNAILAVYDSLLEKWPVPFEKISLKTRHGDTFVIAGGDKSLPPLILLHGSSSNSAMWIGDISEYTKYYRVYAVDLPGEPGKSADIRPDLTTLAYSDWMKDVLEELKIEKASFVGISLGGWLTLKFATVYPDKIDRLVLLCPSGIGPQKASVMLYMLPLKLLGKWGDIKAVKKIMGTKELSEETIEYCRLISKNFSPFTGLVPVFSDEELKRLTSPIMLIVGEKDVLLDSKKTAERVKKALPQAQIILLSGAGHGLVDQTERIIPFLRGKDIT
ncbi:MAG: alpha/beta hydrolase [Clostridiaceae bacterium]